MEVDADTVFINSIDWPIPRTYERGGYTANDKWVVLMSESSDIGGASLSPQIKRDYNVVRLLGKGGMGDVYLAEQLRVGRRPVALKVLNRSCCDDPELKRRFENEAASAGRIHHPNVVMVYECRATDDGQLYVAMQYVEGTDLGQEIERRGPLPLAEIVEITRQAAAGLGAAHKLGIVHRDVKPANIMLTHDDDGQLVVRVLDFGIARLSEPDSTGSHTKTGIVMGTPHFMSPEQALGKTGDKIDRRSDIYSLAMAVYQMLTGSVAFDSDSWMQVIYKHINEAPVPPSQARPQLGNISPIDQVVMKGLEKDREKRYQSAVEFARDLEAAYLRVKSGNTDEGHTAIHPRPGAEAPMTSAPATQGPAAFTPKSADPIQEPTVLTRPAQPTAQAGGETARTAVLVVEGLEAGSTIAYGEGQRSVAGLDGRATVPLGPGTHEIEVTDPSGAHKKGTVTVTPQELGSFKSVSLQKTPAQKTPAQKPPAQQSPATSSSGRTTVQSTDQSGLTRTVGVEPHQEPRSSAGKKIAAAIAAVIILGLAAVAYFVMRGPAQPAQQVESIGGNNTRREQHNKNAPESKEETKKEEAAEKVKQEEAAKAGRNPRENAPVVAPPPVPQAPQVTFGQAANGQGTCVFVTVKKADGNGLEDCLLTLTDAPSGKAFEAKTGPKGMNRFCGLIPGRQMTLKVQGPMGKVLGTRQFVVKNGANTFEFQA
jgi:serine/threonine protein kinase